ncbi:phage holin family protein [Aquicoccus sp. SCR17]|nr:phage holin family protein [Carideicomes alvinocaridis]
MSDAIGHMSSILRKEIDLARAEISQALNRAGVALGLVLAGTVFALVALNVLAAAAVEWVITAGFAAGIAALIVGGVVLVLAIILLAVGVGQLKKASLAPKRVADNVKKDAAALKGATER